MEACDRQRGRNQRGNVVATSGVAEHAGGEGVTLMATAPVMALFLGRMEGDPIQLSGVAAAGLALAGVACTSL